MASVLQTSSKMNYFPPLQSLIEGGKFIKWSDNEDISVGVDLYMDPKGYILYWRDFNKVFFIFSIATGVDQYVNFEYKIFSAFSYHLRWVKNDM